MESYNKQSNLTNYINCVDEIYILVAVNFIRISHPKQTLYSSIFETRKGTVLNLMT